MFENGILKKNELGQYQAVVDPAESEYIRSEVSKTKRKNAMSGLEAEEIQKQLEKLENEEVEDGMEWGVVSSDNFLHLRGFKTTETPFMWRQSILGLL